MLTLYFFSDRFLVIPNYFTLEQAGKLKQRADKLLEEFSLEGHPMTQFSTGGDNGNKHVGDDYFLDSGDKIRFFFEEGAFNEKGELTRPKEKSINKIGHGLHMLDDVFAPFSVNESLATMARQVGFVSPKVLQSMLIFKVRRKITIHGEYGRLTCPFSCSNLISVERVGHYKCNGWFYRCMVPIID